ncbi:LacI family DNA-binding transcriptional regulator [Ruania halotolerans]|uniref:LacI family DNA-binding transcriptional regulator n=1 Tax=Ruania halotolerans TaxID=2897773 RepID=UPI001E4023A4|nr:LacI family DNA-binding transcriptional regulator [Ruania halotolerans]UFU08005.1 LacI family transcriptional regulator [Ruania halotolerans]
MTTKGTPSLRITQRRIAELAGVSQSTVSLVVNGKADAISRIPAETRERVMQVLREAEYVADPAARRLAGVGNRLIGVFTYEPAFPAASRDFYTSLLTGIESQAERLGYDLLMFTSAPVHEGRRRLFHPANRLRLADGCLLLGLEMDGGELERLVDSGFPFVAIGRRAARGVPYVAADYVAGTAELVERAWNAGHRSFALLHRESTGESVLDRLLGFDTELQRRSPDGAALALRRATDGLELEADWAALRRSGATVAFVEDPHHAQRIHAMAMRDGVSVPGDLSLVTLADPSHGSATDPDLTRLSPPRTRLGAEALTLLGRILDPDVEVTDSERRITLPCALVSGSTLAAPTTPNLEETS